MGLREGALRDPVEVLGAVGLVLGTITGRVDGLPVGPPVEGVPRVVGDLRWIVRPVVPGCLDGMSREPVVVRPPAGGVTRVEGLVRGTKGLRPVDPWGWVVPEPRPWYERYEFGEVRPAAS